MKVLKIVLAILIPVAVVCGVLPFVYPLVKPVAEGAELDFGELFKTFFEVFSDFSTYKEMFGFPIFVMLAAFGVGGLLFVLWLVFSIVKKHFLGILFAFISALVLEIAALGVFIDMTYVFAIETGVFEENALYKVMEYIALGSIVLFIAAFVIHVIIMFKDAKAKKAAKKAAKAAKEASVASSEYEIDYNDLPPVLFEEHKKDVEPEFVLHKVEHIEVGPNHVLKGHYVRDDEINALLASKRYAEEEDIPESILEFLETKHRAEESGENLPIFDPNFVPTHEEDLLTEEEKFVLEALRAYKPKEEVEEVPDRVRAFLESKPVEEPVEDLPIFDPRFQPVKEEPEVPSLSEEELGVVEAMAHFEPKKEPDEPQYFGVDDEDYVDLPFFREHEEPVEFVEEILRVERPSEEVHAPKLANAKPVHVSKNKEGKYQLKQVGEEKAFAEFDSEAEAIRFAETVKKVNGVAVRIHDDEGKIRSL